MPSPTFHGGSSSDEVDRLFAALAHPTRRRVVGTVLESDGRVEVETVAETVADGSLSVEEVTTGLVHNHLPRLGEAGLIRHDRGSNHLEATETTGRAGGLIRIAVPSD